MTIMVLLASFLMLSIVQISIFKSFPTSVRNLFATLPLLAVVINFMLSGMILFFTGVGATAGISNLAASVIFGGYLAIYKNYRRLGKIQWKKWGFFMGYPHVEMGNQNENWLF